MASTLRPREDDSRINARVGAIAWRRKRPRALVAIPYYVVDDDGQRVLAAENEGRIDRSRNKTLPPVTN